MEKKGGKNTWINDCLLHWRLMIHWCLSVLALKVEKSFDDGGLRLTDKSWMPPPEMLPHLSYYLVMCSTVIAMVTHCYFISSLPRRFKQKAEEPESRLPLALYLPTLSALFSISLLSLSGSVHHIESTFVP